MSATGHPRFSTQTVSVYTRHSKACRFRGKPHHRNCNCRKYLNLRKDGANKTVSAKTRTWSAAESKAAEIRDQWDPLKQKERSLNERLEAMSLEAVRIDFALDRWLKMIRNGTDNDNTFSKYQTAAKQIGEWSRENQLDGLSDLTPARVDEWKNSWKPNAKRVSDRIGKTTAARRLEMLKRFTNYCVRMNWINKDPVAEFDAIAPDHSVTLPLLSGRYEAVLEATYKYDEEMRPDDRFGAELRALIELMRWSGLRIGDALALPRSALKGNRVSLRKMQKSGRPLTVIIPDHVCEALQNLEKRPTVDPNYFFWSGNSRLKSLTGQWQRKLKRLNKYLNLVDDEGRPMRFHSHQLRDTFAVEHLLKDTSMQDLSHMLGHKSVNIYLTHKAMAK